MLSAAIFPHECDDIAVHRGTGPVGDAGLIRRIIHSLRGPSIWIMGSLPERPRHDLRVNSLPPADGYKTFAGVLDEYVLEAVILAQGSVNVCPVPPA
jgi:hypothetical protein